jgi:tetratricopeptide (TPR) repeat protein
MPIRLVIFCLFISLSSYSQNAVDEQGDNLVAADDLKAELTFMDGMKYYNIENFKMAETVFKGLTEKDSKSGAAFFMLSKSQTNLEKWQLAEKSAEKAVEIEKENTYYLEQYALLLNHNQQFKEAANVLKKLIKISPNKIANYFKLAEVLSVEGKDSDALRVFDDIEKNIGYSEEASQRKQMLLLSKNKVDAALKEGNKIVKNDPAYILEQAKIMLTNNRTDDAEMLLKNAIADVPNFGEAYDLLSDIYFKIESPKQSLELLNNALKLESLSASVKIKLLFNYIGSTKGKLSLEETDAAIKIAESLSVKNPDEATLYVIKGDLNYKKANLKEARENYLKAVAINKGLYEAWLAIVELDTKIGSMKDLEKHTEKALEYYPNQGFFWYHNGFALTQNKKYEDAIFALEEAAALSTQNLELSTHIQAQLADLYAITKDYRKAEKSYQMILTKNPNQEQALFGYCKFLLVLKKDLPVSKSLAEKLISIKPKESDYLAIYAQTLAQTGDFKKALTEINEAEKNAPQDSKYIFDLKGDILYKLNLKTEAKTYWEKAKTLSPEDATLDKKLNEGI